MPSSMGLASNWGLMELEAVDLTIRLLLAALAPKSAQVAISMEQPGSKSMTEAAQTMQK